MGSFSFQFNITLATCLPAHLPSYTRTHSLSLSYHSNFWICSLVLFLYFIVVVMEVKTHNALLNFNRTLGNMDTATDTTLRPADDVYDNP